MIVVKVTKGHASMGATTVGEQKEVVLVGGEVVVVVERGAEKEGTVEVGTGAETGIEIEIVSERWIVVMKDEIDPEREAAIV